MITIAAPAIDEEELRAVQEVLRSGMLASGPRAKALEEAFAELCGTEYAVALNSGTAALHAALFAAGVGAGDEVITTPFSFAASVNVILMCGAKPVLVDIEPQTFNLDISKVEQAITTKTKAVLPVHLYGQPYDHDALESLANTYGFKIIEDACQAHGAEYKGKRVGSLGDMGCFSFYATKNVMSGEGGIVTTDDEAYAATIRRFRQHGMNTQYEYEHIGYNYRMSDLHAAIAHEQLKKIQRFTALRRRNARILSAGLAGIKGLVLPVAEQDRTHVYNQFTVRITEDFALPRDTLVTQLKNRGIVPGVYYPKPLHAFPHIAAFGYQMGDFPVAEQAANEVLSLPVHPLVSIEQTATIVRAIAEIANG